MFKFHARAHPVEEIINFASVGTEIASEVMNLLEENEKNWNTDRELAEFVKSSLEKELGTNYKWFKGALHFVCNPLDIHDSQIDKPNGNRAIRSIINGLRDE